MNAMFYRNFSQIQWGLFGLIIMAQVVYLGHDFASLFYKPSEELTRDSVAPSMAISNSIPWTALGKSSNSGRGSAQLFHLLGTFEAKPSSKSSAVIGNAQGNDQNLYQIGDKLSDGSKVHHINKEAVVIQRPDGELVSIKMEELLQTGEGPTAANPVIPSTQVPPYTPPLNQNWMNPEVMKKLNILRNGAAP